ncbi:MAG: DUF2461 domain-containing protein [Cytophagales bacterium]|nr:DUF2461 domain-containing protein [Cytophaga sp.]
MQLQLVLDFLKKLKKNNSKEWFDANRPAYEKAKNEVKELVGEVLAKVAVFDPSIASLEVKDCMFRINRDVRFAKDKSPYKTNMAFMIAPRGKKSIKSCYYFHIEPGNCFVAGGIYMPLPEHLKLLRQEVDYSGDELKKLFASKEFKKYFTGFEEEAKLVRMPQGYTEDHVYSEWLKLKSFTVTSPFDDVLLSNKDIVKQITDPFMQLYKLNQFLNKALD